jgi:hypothetical protein
MRLANVSPNSQALGQAGRKLDELHLAGAAVDKANLPSLVAVGADGSQYTLGTFLIHNGNHADAHVKHLMHLGLGDPALGLQQFVDR